MNDNFLLNLLGEPKKNKALAAPDTASPFQQTGTISRAEFAQIMTTVADALSKSQTDLVRHVEQLGQLVYNSALALEQPSIAAEVKSLMKSKGFTPPAGLKSKDLGLGHLDLVIGDTLDTSNKSVSDGSWIESLWNGTSQQKSRDDSDLGWLSNLWD